MEPLAEANEIEIIEIEEYAAQGKKPPKAKRYRIRVNNDRFIFEIDNPTREQILEMAGLSPVNKYSLRLKLKGGGHRLIGEGEHVDLTEPGVERFKALRRDQTEG